MAARYGTLALSSGRYFRQVCDGGLTKTSATVGGRTLCTGGSFRQCTHRPPALLSKKPITSGIVGASRFRHRWLPLAAVRNFRDQSTLSALTDRLRDIVETWELHPSNPVLDAVDVLCRAGHADVSSSSAPHLLLPDLSRVKARHLSVAAEIAQADYDDALAQLEDEIVAAGFLDENADDKDEDDPATEDDDEDEDSDAIYEAVISKLDEITIVPRFVVELATLLGSVAPDEVARDALRGGFGGTGGISGGGRGEEVRIRETHLHSEVLRAALSKLERKLERKLQGRQWDEEGSSGDITGVKERLNAVRHVIAMIERENSSSLLPDEESWRQFVGLKGDVAEAEQALLSSAGRDGRSVRPPTPSTMVEQVKLMYRIIIGRAEIARIRGYQSFADMSLGGRRGTAVGGGAASVEDVTSLHDAIANRLLPQMTPEFVERNELERTRGEEEDFSLYFELEDVLGGMFRLARSLFGIVIEEETQRSEVRGWHPDVRLFHVYDEDGGEGRGQEPIASFYLDPFRRRHKSARNFAGILTQKRRDGIKPIMYMCCNIIPPAWDTDPVSLKFEDVETLFHEFGHCLEYVLADVEFGSFSWATENELEASEFVSQFLEYWLFENQFLNSFASHRRTGESLSSAQMAELKRARIARKKDDLSMHIFLSELELELNGRRFDPKGDESIVAVQNRIARRYRPHDSPSKGNISPLVHVFTSGGMMMHKYVWSEVMSADAFKAFREVGCLDDKERAKELGMSFRRCILEVGGAASVGEKFEKFRGRRATCDALFETFEL